MSKRAYGMSGSRKKATRYTDGDFAGYSYFTPPQSTPYTVSVNQPGMRGGAKANPAIVGAFRVPRGYEAAGVFSKGQEYKRKDLPQTVFTLNSTAYFKLLNGVQNGSANYNRIGSKICMKTLHIWGQVEMLPRTTTDEDFVRFAVVYDRQANGAAPNFSDIFRSVDDQGTQTNDVWSQFNYDNKDRFIVLMDKRRHLPSYTNTAGVITNVSMADTSENYTFNRYIKLKQLETHYKASSNPAVIGDISTGSLYFVALGQIASGSEGWQGEFACRLRYSDI